MLCYGEVVLVFFGRSLLRASKKGLFLSGQALIPPLLVAGALKKLLFFAACLNFAWKYWNDRTSRLMGFGITLMDPCMVFILDDCSFHVAHIWSKQGILICWRHLVKSKESLNPIFFLGKDLVYIIGAHREMSNYLI